MDNEAPTRLWLPRTGQTVTSPTANYADGDDGYYQAGNPRATRFIDNGNGTISDRATGLQWVKQPELIIPGAVGIHATNQIQVAHGDWADATAYVLADVVEDTVDSKFYVCIHAHTSDDGSGTDTDAPNTGSAYWRETVWIQSAVTIAPAVPKLMIWSDAVANSLGTAHGGSLEYAGFTDWRLPNLFELFVMRDAGAAYGSEWSSLFTNGIKSYYWSSTSPPTNATYAQTVNFNNGTYTTVPVLKTTAYNVRPVRGGRLNANW